MPVSVGGYSQGPSCWDRVTTGFAMGACAGLAMGALFGGISLIRQGHRGLQLLEGMGKCMVQYGGSFGVFLAIGTGIRC